MNFVTETSQARLINPEQNGLLPSSDLDYGLEAVEDLSLNESQLGSTTSAIELSPLSDSTSLSLTSDDSQQIVFISSAVEDSQTLVDNISGVTEVVVLNSSQNELVQISEHLSIKN